MGGLDEDGLRRYRCWHRDWLAGRAVPVLRRHGMAGALRLTKVPDRSPASRAPAPAGCVAVAAATMVLRLLGSEVSGRDGS